MSVRSEEVMEKLHNHPLFKKVMATVTPAERAQIEERVTAFVGQLTTSMSTVASHPQAREKMREAAQSTSQTSGSVG